MDTRASISRGYRAPSPIEQFVTASQSGFRVVPNPALQGEKAWAGELGATATLGGRLWLDGSVFQSEYYDLIDPAPVSGQFGVFQFQNVERSRVRGLDLETKLSLVEDRLGLHATYAYLHAVDLNLGGPLPYRSPHNLAASLAGLVQGWDWGLDFRYRSRVDRVLVYPLDPRTAITLFDLRLARHFLGWDLQGKISNLTQRRYVDVQERTPGAPRRLLFTALRNF